MDLLHVFILLNCIQMRGVDWYFSFGVAISKLVNKRLYILSTKNNNESRRNYLYHTLCMMSN